MKRLFSFVLSLVLVLSLAGPARAVESTPTPPSLCPADEYVVFKDDPVYQEENWKRILELRAYAEAGEPRPENGFEFPIDTPGSRYELAFIDLYYRTNTGTYVDLPHVTTFGYIFKKADSPEELCTEKDLRMIDLWDLRSSMMAGLMRFNNYRTYDYLDTFHPSLCGKLEHVMEESQLTLEDIYDVPFMDFITPAARASMERQFYYYKNRISVEIDSKEVINSNREPEGRPYIENGRTMVPIRIISERLGADVDWDEVRREVHILRAGHEIVLPIDQNFVYIDGTEHPLHTPACIKNGKTMVPLRFISEFFDQSVTWDSQTRTVSIVEDKSVAGNSNLEDWAIPMGIMLSAVSYFTNETFGRGRGNNYPWGDGTSLVTTTQLARSILLESWDIGSREELINTICQMTKAGHNSLFLEIAKSADTDAYTKAVYKKWGDRGILCWDLFRMSNLAQWGYEAGFITYCEALALVEPAVRRLQENFSSWEEAYENYLFGYCWWSGTGTADINIWETPRGRTYTRLKEKYGELFDDELFKREIIGVPGLTAQDVLESVQNKS